MIGQPSTIRPVLQAEDFAPEVNFLDENLCKAAKSRQELRVYRIARR